MENWKSFYEEGLQYLKTALNGSCKPEIFTPVIIYNIAGMAIEKLLMGFLAYHGKLPENHTMADMLREVQKVSSISTQLKKKLLYMDSFQNICSIENYNTRIPGEKDIRLFLTAAVEIKIFIEKGLGNESDFRKNS